MEETGTGPVDVSPLISSIESYGPVITSIGLAVLAVYVGIKAFRWIKSAM